MESPSTEATLRESALDRLMIELDRLVVDETAPGERLPSEGELAIRFGVSRITVREAMKVLAGRDLVDLGAGRRAVVRGPTSETLAGHLDVLIRRDPTASLQLIEVREALEVQAATLAAQRITSANADRLAAAIERMSVAAAGYSATGDAGAFNEADVEFHEVLGEISGNRMLSVMLLSLEGALRDSFTESFRGHIQLGAPVQAGLDEHVRIYKKVAAGDARGAAAAMRSMLKASAKSLQATVGDSRGSTSR